MYRSGLCAESDRVEVTYIGESYPRAPIQVGEQTGK